ncbi:secreted effector protein [Leclercia adecarboxylata]|nr:secreted effector protein [Leclercia adecarboxylata]KMN61129.1 secreted effector protein [Leclercia sp. LK8]
MDEIARLLRKEGLVPSAACLPGCGLWLGQQVELYPYRLVYRIDEDNLILCSFHRVPDSQPQHSSMVGLWRILCRLFQQVSWLRAVRMLVITDVWDRLLAMQRHQLVRLLHKLGAVMVFHNNESWLEITVDTLCNHRKRTSSHY